MNLAQRILVGLVRAYQIALSPYFGQHCRFTPTCSQYMREAVERHGAWRGLGLGLRRIGHCHPRHPGGYDPVP